MSTSLWSKASNLIQPVIRHGLCLRLWSLCLLVLTLHSMSVGLAQKCLDVILEAATPKPMCMNDKASYLPLTQLGRARMCCVFC